MSGLQEKRRVVSKQNSYCLGTGVAGGNTLQISRVGEVCFPSWLRASRGYTYCKLLEGFKNSFYHVHLCQL